MTIMLYDADGVWMDSRAAHGKLIFDYARRVGHAIPTDVLGKTIKGPEDVWRSMRNPMDVVFRDFGFPEKTIPALMEDYRRQLPEYGVSLYKQVTGALRDKRSRYTNIVTTSNYADTVYQIAKLNNSTDLFDGFVGLEHVVRSKPNPECIVHALRQPGVRITDKSKIYFVGDSPSDIKTAHNFNLLVKNFPRIMPVAVGWGFNDIDVLIKENPDFVVERESQWKLFLRSPEKFKL